jgi:hypothetical protein
MPLQVPQDPVITDDGVTTPAPLPVAENFATVRTNPVTGYIDVLGVVGSKYNDQFCDQLLAQLRESPSPLTTREVAAGIRVRRIELWPVRGGLTARVGDTVLGRCIVSCEGTDRQGNVVYLVAKPAPARTIYRDLAALAARGMVQRLNGIPGSRAVRWAYRPNADTVAPSDVAALEGLLNSPAAPRRRDTRQRKDR